MDTPESSYRLVGRAALPPPEAFGGMPAEKLKWINPLK
jgi:hypothetical protein